jgi:hypothetical protein
MVRRCAGCGRLFADYDDGIEIDDEIYCSNCAHYCSSCDEYHLGESTYIASEDRYVCNDCLNEYYVKCAVCGEWVNQDDATHIERENIEVCRSCLDDLFCMCADCEEWFRNEDMIKDVDGVHRCKECAKEREEQEDEE